MEMTQEARMGRVMSCLKPSTRELFVVMLMFFVFKVCIVYIKALETMMQVRERLGTLVGIRCPEESSMSRSDI